MSQQINGDEDNEPITCEIVKPDKALNLDDVFIMADEFILNCIEITENDMPVLNNNMTRKLVCNIHQNDERPFSKYYKFNWGYVKDDNVVTLDMLNSIVLDKNYDSVIEYVEGFVAPLPILLSLLNKIRIGMNPSSILYHVVSGNVYMDFNNN